MWCLHIFTICVYWYTTKVYREMNVLYWICTGYVINMYMSHLVKKLLGLMNFFRKSALLMFLLKFLDKCFNELMHWNWDKNGPHSVLQSEICTTSHISYHIQQSWGKVYGQGYQSSIVKQHFRFCIFRPFLTTASKNSEKQMKFMSVIGLITPSPELVNARLGVLPWILAIL